VLYSQGIKETLHIHHAGYDDHFDVDVMYHGLLFDTLFKGYFLEWDGLSVLGGKIESNTLVDDPDPIESLLSTLGYHPAASEHIADGTADVFADLDLDVDSPRAFLEDRLRAELERCWDRADSTHNAMDLLAIRNQPVLPFHTHLADNYLESFVAIDSELLAWHRHAPPDVRHGQTFRRAINAVDPEILRHRPPNQPHTSRYLNEIERFLRRKLPVVEAFEPAWPDRRDLYDDYDLDERLFPEHPEVHGLPARQKLRVNDVRWWLS
jgi:asparagine synthase (glutamine-hydrolysing)